MSASSAGAQDNAPRDDGDISGQPTIGLMGTIPIYWGETSGFDELLSGDASPHWARTIVERRAELVPLDYLSDAALAPHRRLLLAQPRGLSGEENVALDSWVRGGGRLLLFADPWMTGESRFHIGDRRRPQDVMLLSPILAHWGLEMEAGGYLEEGGLEHADFNGQLLPMNMAGEFKLLADGEACELELAGVLAHCRIGAGQVLIMADAAILDFAGPYPHAESGLESLLLLIFPQLRENAGIHAETQEVTGGNSGFSPNFVSGITRQDVEGGENTPQ